MQFTNPIWLWALFGVLIPVGIHILSRKTGKVILIGSIRYLRESATAQFRHIKLNEIPLLLLRSFLVLLFVLLLAGTVMKWPPAPLRKWVVIEEKIEKNERVQTIINSLENQGYEVRRMASGFPLLSDSPQKKSGDNYYTLVRELTSENLDSIVAISYNFQRKFKGERVRLPPNIKWLGQDVGEKEFMFLKMAMSNDSIWIRKGNTSPFITSFETQKTPSLPAGDSLPYTEPQTLDIEIFTGEGFAYEEKVLMASLKVVQSITPNKIRISNKNANAGIHSSAGLIFWLANESPPHNQSAATIAYRPCNGENLPAIISSQQAFLHCDGAQHASWIITKHLNEEIALKENITLQLAQLILPKLKNDQYDHRVLPEPMIWSDNDATEVFKKEARGNMETVIIILLLLALFSERWLAFKRNQ